MNRWQSSASTTRKRQFSGEQGSVLMEAVIVLPLFMALLGGIMWSGQLIYDKQKLVIADRYVAWNHGNRFGQNSGDVQERFFDEITTDHVYSIDTRNLDSSPWWHEVQGSASLIAVSPDWTRGWFYPIYYLEQASKVGAGKEVPEFAALNGRDLMGGKAAGHAVFMRHTLTSDRDNAVYPEKELTESFNWAAIRDENWPTNR